MLETTHPAGDLPPELADRLVRYTHLKPCTTAFVDTRTPGSTEKENFTIIGPGVSENPEQHVHIDLAHGFNIGATRQPPGCVNSQHSHETAEVFIVHRGRWAFHLGENADDGTVELLRGDTISIPTNVFRGFENIGDEVGFMFAALGGDDPGRVMWARYVFEQATKFGLILLDDGSLIDTTKGQAIPDGRKPLQVPSPEQAAGLRSMTGADLEQCVVRFSEPQLGSDSVLLAHGALLEQPLIGAACPDENICEAPLNWPHGFQLRRLAVAPASHTHRHTRQEEEVIMMHAGTLRLKLDDGSCELTAGDVFTVPIGTPRQLVNNGSQTAIAHIVRGSNHPKAAKLALAKGVRA